MCIKQYLGYICGHCSIPELIRCPLTAQNSVYPPCHIPAERPIQTNENCHPCLRVLWNQKVLAEEEEHRQAHLRNECLCEVVFDGEDKVYRVQLAKERHANNKGKSRNIILNALRDPNCDPRAASGLQDNVESSYKAAERISTGNEGKELVYKFVRGSSNGSHGQQAHGHGQTEPARDYQQDTPGARSHSHHGGRGMAQARHRGNFTNSPHNSYARSQKNWDNELEGSAHAYAGYYVVGSDNTRNISQGGHQEPNMQPQTPPSPAQSYESTVSAIITPGSDYQKSLLPRQQTQGCGKAGTPTCGKSASGQQGYSQPSTYAQPPGQGYVQNPVPSHRQIYSQGQGLSSPSGLTYPTGQGHRLAHFFNQPYNQPPSQHQPSAAQPQLHSPISYCSYASYAAYTAQPPQLSTTGQQTSFTPYIGQPLFGKNPYSDPNFNPSPIIGYGPTPYQDFFPWERVHPDQLMTGQIGAGIRYYSNISNGGPGMGAGNVGGHPPLPPRLEGVPMFDEGRGGGGRKGKPRSEPSGDAYKRSDAGGYEGGESSPAVVNSNMGIHEPWLDITRSKAVTLASPSSSIEPGPRDVSNNIDNTEHEALLPIITHEMSLKRSS
ncbi:hypothetical protein BGZ60DRAFT_261563 [Tricladium varicosporioides]|nr:hypothetical protein BGZ60DRAFT_261563 [Hymenoscyphus varicosporioides]